MPLNMSDRTKDMLKESSIVMMKSLGYGTLGVASALKAVTHIANTADQYQSASKTIPWNVLSSSADVAMWLTLTGYGLWKMLEVATPNLPAEDKSEIERA